MKPEKQDPKFTDWNSGSDTQKILSETRAMRPKICPGFYWQYIKEIGFQLFCAATWTFLISSNKIQGFWFYLEQWSYHYSKFAHSPTFSTKKIGHSSRKFSREDYEIFSCHLIFKAIWATVSSIYKTYIQNI